MQRFRDFLKRKDIEISLRRYGIDALGAMAQGLFCSLLIGTILSSSTSVFSTRSSSPSARVRLQSATRSAAARR